MKIFASICKSFLGNKKIHEKWNKNHKIKFEDCGVRFNLPKDLDEYLAFKEFYGSLEDEIIEYRKECKKKRQKDLKEAMKELSSETSPERIKWIQRKIDSIKKDLEEYKEYNRKRDYTGNVDTVLDTDFSGSLRVKFTTKEYQKMDKLILNVLGAEYLGKDNLEKFFKITKCKECGAIIHFERIASLRFDDDVFCDEDDIDYLDINTTTKTAMFFTDFRTLIVSEKVKNIIVENNITGVQLEKVYFNQKSPPFYALNIKERVGDLIYPLPEIYGETCKVCGTRKESTRFFTNELIFDTPDICFNLNKDWRLWAVTIKAGPHIDYDILRTDYESYTSNDQIIISPRFYKLLLQNNIKGFNLIPVQIVD